MMRHLLEGMQSLEEQELRYARKDHGDNFPALADGHLALIEEVQEAQEDWMCVQAAYTHLMTVYRRENRVDRTALARIESKALHGACELVQVATVARKMRESEGCCGNGEKSLCEDMP